MLRTDCTKFLELTRIEFKLRDQGTFLGFFWTLLNPFLSFVILYMLFSKTLGASSSSFGAYLLVGLIFWSLFATGTGNGSSAVMRRAHYLHVAPVSPAVVIGAGVASILISSLLESALALAYIFFTGKGVILTLGGLFSYLAGLFAVSCVCFGISCILSVISILFYDVGYLWGIALRLGFFITPVFYTIDTVPSQYHWIVKLNPLYQIVTAARMGLIEQNYLLNVWLSVALLSVFFVFFGIIIVHKARYLLNEL